MESASLDTPSTSCKISSFREAVTPWLRALRRTPTQTTSEEIWAFLTASGNPKEIHKSAILAKQIALVEGVPLAVETGSST